MANVILIPVLDVRGGQVVHAVAGRRADYRPLQSQLTAGSTPHQVLTALRELCGESPVYVADLEGIEHNAPQWPLLADLCRAGGPLWIDAGWRHPQEVIRCLQLGHAHVIAGLESTPTPEALRSLVAISSPARLAFSLDLQAGRLRIPSGGTWPSDPLATVKAAVEQGVSRLIVLDLADVGCETGGTSRTLCAAIRQEFPTLELIAGGGVRHAADLRAWQAIGVTGLLLATALHTGAISAAVVREFNTTLR